MKCENGGINMKNAIECMFIPVMPECPKLAHAYVPFQYPSCIYQPDKGLERGTIFPCLDRPYGEDPEYLVDQ
jgi:hypothetical protein